MPANQPSESRFTDGLMAGGSIGLGTVDSWRRQPSQWLQCCAGGLGSWKAGGVQPTVEVMIACETSSQSAYHNARDLSSRSCSLTGYMFNCTALRWQWNA